MAGLEWPTGEGKEWPSVKLTGVSGAIVLEITFSLVRDSKCNPNSVYIEKECKGLHRTL